MTKRSAVLFLLLMMRGGSALSGSLDSLASPASSTSAMYSVSDVYDRLATGTAGALRSGAFAEPGSAPGPTGHTLNEIMSKAPSLDSTSGAAQGDVLTSKTFWGLTSNQWGRQTGSIPAQVLSPASNAVPAGYYAATNLMQVNTNLATGNIRAGVTVFGVTGKTEVVDTASGDAAAGDMLAGKKAWAKGAEVTGNVPAGSNRTGAVGALVITITDGLYSGSKTATAIDTNLVTGNIRAGASIFGVGGQAEVVNTASGDAAAGDMLAGKKGWAKGAEVTGNVPAGSNRTGTAGSLVITIADGLYSGSKTATATDTNLVTGNIRAGVNVFGVAGKTEVVDTTSGDAAAGDMLAGKKAWVDGGEVTGNVPAGSNRTGAAGSLVITIADGLYSGSKTATATDTNLVTGNIRAGVNVFGVAGKTEVVDTTSGDAAAGDMLAGKKAWVDGGAVTGTIQTRLLMAASNTVLAGYYAATNLMQVDTNLMTGNIRAGVNVFGVAGKTEVVDTTSGDAAAGDMLAGKKAWVDGGEVTGNVPAGSNRTGAAGALVITIADGLYSGSKTATATDTNLVTGNIKAGVNIFGVAGKADVVDTSTGDAAAGDMLAGKKAWVDGAEVTGNVPAGSNCTGAAGALVITIADGLYSGSKTATATDTDLVTGNIKVGVNIFGVAGKTEVVDTTSGNATAPQILATNRAWVDGVEITGTMPSQILSSASISMPTGYYTSTNLNQVDTDLTNVNIRGGISIFGVLGTRYAPIANTGQQTPYRAGDDGSLKHGVPWPAPRFTRGAAGAATNTVVDSLTGLVWAWDAGLMGKSVTTNWNAAVDFCNNLTNLVYGGRSDWRLPTRFELESLLDLGQSLQPILPSDAPFTNADSALYWTSTTDGTGISRAWFVNLQTGQIDRQAKTTSNCRVWPVAGGE